MTEKYICSFCLKEFKTLSGKNGHEPTCKSNPNKISAWNKGLDKTDERVNKYSKSMKETKNSIEYKNNHSAWNKGLDKTDERVNKYSKSGKETKNNPEWKEHHLENVYKKYNGKHFTQTEQYKQNMKSALFKKYGTTSLMDVPEICDNVLNGRYKFKEYIYPSGNKIYLQGYENYAIDILLLSGCAEENIITGKKLIPKIYWYDEEKTKHRYYPDIFIPNLNLIIEVKSKYTITDNKYKNIKKHKASIEGGYYHEIWLIHDGELIDKIKDLEKYYNSSK